MIKITADSTCDLSPDIISNLEIMLFPLFIVIDDKVFRDGVDITPEDIFRYVEEGKSCKTTAANVHDYEEFFSGIAGDYNGIIHLNIGSGFSSCYQNAVTASKSFDNVYVIDTKNLSAGSGYLVHEAAKLAAENYTPQEICQRIEEMVDKVDASFVIDRMDYLYKGGRCSGFQMLGAKVMQIKPCIQVKDSIMKVGKKYRGDFEWCLEKYVKDKLMEKESIDYKRIYITHPACDKEVVENVITTIKSCGDFSEIIVTKAGCTVSSHCGPNTLGIFFKYSQSL